MHRHGYQGRKFHRERDQRRALLKGLADSLIKYESIETTLPKAKEIVPDISFSQDMIIGFCTETEEDHQDTLSLMREVEYDYGYMFAYSERPGTPAHKKMEDDIPADVKQRRLAEVIALQGELSKKRMASYVGRVHEILIEGISKKNKNQWKGRNSQNAVCVFDMKEGQKIGDLVSVFVHGNTQGTLLGETVL